MEELLDLNLADCSKEELENIKFVLTEAKKLTYQEEKALPDDAFAVVVTKKGKSGKILKIRKYPIKGTDDDETRVRAALRYLGMPRSQKALRKLGISPRSVLKKILKRAKELGMTDLLKRHKKEATLDKTYFRKLLRKAVSEKREAQKTSKALATKIEKFVKGIKKLASKIRDLRKQKASVEIKVASLQEELEKAKAFTVAQATKALERRKELGEFATNLTDEQLVDDTSYEIAKAKKIIAEKEKVELEAKKQDLKVASLNIGDKTQEDEWAEKRRKVNENAWGKPQK